MTISRMVSGGQTGADRGGLDAAIWCSLPCGGWVPKGRKAEDGHIPSTYGCLKETASASYPARTESNIVDSDCTLVLTYGPATGGSALTVRLAKKHHKPFLTVDLDEPRPEAVTAIVEWLRAFCTENCTLNVAGSRESKSPGIQDSVMRLMIDVISKANGKTFYPPAGADITRWLIRESKPGDVVRLTDLTDGHEPGFYVFLGHDDDSITLCPVGENDNGDMCRTDSEFTLPVRSSRLLRKTDLSVGDAGDDAGP